MNPPPEENPSTDLEDTEQSATDVGEVILNPGTDDPGPDITSEDAAQASDEERARQELYPPTGHGKVRASGAVTFGGDVESRQAEALGAQMTRSIENQLQIASEHIQHISWIETDGSRHDADSHPHDLEITRFELILSNGKVITIEGPLMHLHIQN